MVPSTRVEFQVPAPPVPVHVVVFGCISIPQGFVKSYSMPLAIRFFGGLAETNIFFRYFYLIAMSVP